MTVDPYADIASPVVYGPGNPALAGQSVTPAQAAAFHANPPVRSAPVGSPQNPYGSATNNDVPQAQYYRDTSGNLRQAQPVFSSDAAGSYDAISSPVPGVGEDMLKGGGAGLVRGLARIADMLPGGAHGDMMSALNRVMAPLAANVTGLSPDRAQQLSSLLAATAPKSTDQMMSAGGINYHAQTVPGQYAQTLAEFAPNAVGGGEGLLPKIAAAAVPALVSETAGQVTKGTDAEPWARTLAGLFAGGALGVRAGASANALNDPDILAQIGVAPDAKPADISRALAYVGGKVRTAGPDALQPTDLPVTAAEALGKPGQVGLASLARQQGKTPDLVQGLLQPRAEQRSARILQGVQDATGIAPDAARGNVEAIISAGQAKAAPLYDAVRQNPEPIINPQLRALQGRPAIQRAMRAAYDNALNSGSDPEAMGLSRVTRPVPGGGRVDEQVEFTAPTANTWDLVKKTLNSQVERNPITGKPLPDSQSMGNAGISQADQALTTALRQHVPGYSEALDTAGEYKSVEGAYNRTRGWLLGQSKNQTPTDFANLWGSLRTPAEQDAARSAMMSDFYDQAQAGRLTVAKLKVPAVQAKLQTAFGPDAASKLTDMIANEGKMQGAERMLLPAAGSQTDVLAAERQLQGSPNLAGELAADFIPHAVMGSPKTGAAVAIGRQLSKIVAPMRTGGMSQAARDESGRLLTMKPEELAALLQQLKDMTPRSTPVARLAPIAGLGMLSSYGALSSPAGQ